MSKPRPKRALGKAAEVTPLRRSNSSRETLRALWAGSENWQGCWDSLINTRHPEQPGYTDYASAIYEIGWAAEQNNSQEATAQWIVPRIDGLTRNDTERMDLLEAIYNVKTQESGAAQDRVKRNDFSDYSMNSHKMDFFHPVFMSVFQTLFNQMDDKTQAGKFLEKVIQAEEFDNLDAESLENLCDVLDQKSAQSVAKTLHTHIHQSINDEISRLDLPTKPRQMLRQLKIEAYMGDDVGTKNFKSLFDKYLPNKDLDPTYNPENVQTTSLTPRMRLIK